MPVFVSLLNPCDYFISFRRCRWCRTYFLQRGASLPLLSDAESLVDDHASSERERVEEEEEEEEDQDTGLGNEDEHVGGRAQNSQSQRRVAAFGSASTVAIASYKKSAQWSSICRLELLYSKLWICLRSVVKDVFARNHDVLEAGTAVQVK
jgi:hypothetical protein